MLVVERMKGKKERTDWVRRWTAWTQGPPPPSRRRESATTLDEGGGLQILSRKSVFPSPKGSKASSVCSSRVALFVDRSRPVSMTACRSQPAPEERVLSELQTSTVSFSFPSTHQPNLIRTMSSSVPSPGSKVRRRRALGIVG